MLHQGGDAQGGCDKVLPEQSPGVFARQRPLGQGLCLSALGLHYASLQTERGRRIEIRPVVSIDCLVCLPERNFACFSLDRGGDGHCRPLVEGAPLRLAARQKSQ